MKSYLTLVLLLVATSALGAIRSPKHAEFIKTLGQPMVAYSPGTRFLTWDYPDAELGNVYFEVYHRQDLTGGVAPLQTWYSVPSGFTLLSTVDVPPVPVGGLASDFFVVRARDMITGVYSNWNQ